MPFIVKYPPGKTYFQGKSVSNAEIAQRLAEGLRVGKYLIEPDFAEQLGYKVEWIGPQQIQQFFHNGDGI